MPLTPTVNEKICVLQNAKTVRFSVKCVHQTLPNPPTASLRDG